MYVLEIEKLTVKYGKVLALDNINLKIKDKEFVGIIGPNGGGKTTILKVLLGLKKPTNGKIKFRDNSKIAYVPQFLNFNKDFPITVLDVILTGKLPDKIKLFHKYSRKDISLADNIMDSLDILGLRDRQISQLSGGQMQKVLIARALIMEPKVLLLDEPTASLDSNAKTEIFQLLKELNKEKTIIMVSHDMGVIASFVDSVACLNKKLYYHGDDASLDSETLQKAYGCPIELIAHGETPHRVLKDHKED